MSRHVPLPLLIYGNLATLLEELAPFDYLEREGIRSRVMALKETKFRRVNGPAAPTTATITTTIVVGTTAPDVSTTIAAANDCDKGNFFGRFAG